MITKIRAVALLLTVCIFFAACNNNASDNKSTPTSVNPANDSTADYSQQIAANEKMKADIEVTDPGYAKKEIDLARSAANASIKQEWAKMDVYSDSTGIRKIKVYPYQGISQRSEEFYYNNGKITRKYISDLRHFVKDFISDYRICIDNLKVKSELVTDDNLPFLNLLFPSGINKTD